MKNHPCTFLIYLKPCLVEVSAFSFKGKNNIGSFIKNQPRNEDRSFLVDISNML